MIACHHPVIHLVNGNLARKTEKFSVRRIHWLINARRVQATMISVSALTEEETRNTCTMKT